MATSERDALARKATGPKDAVKQAEGQLGELQVEQEGKIKLNQTSQVDGFHV